MSLSPEREKEIRDGLIVSFCSEEGGMFAEKVVEDLVKEIERLRFWNDQHNKDIERLMKERDELEAELALVCSTRRRVLIQDDEASK